MQDKEALQSQVCAQLKLVSSLRAQVEDLSLGLDQQATGEVVALRQKLEEEKEASSRREKEVRGKTEWERNICNCGHGGSVIGFGAFRQEGHRFASNSSCHAGTLGKSFTHICQYHCCSREHF